MHLPYRFLVQALRTTEKDIRFLYRRDSNLWIREHLRSRLSPDLACKLVLRLALDLYHRRCYHHACRYRCVLHRRRLSRLEVEQVLD